MNLSNLLLSALHNATAAVAATVVTSPAIAPFFATGQPTGGALDYANAHPWVLPLYLVAYFVARDQLKTIVPAFGAVANPAGTSK